jgi:hypothetical protein
MDKRHDTVLETLMEQLIEGGAENMGLVFARGNYPLPFFRAQISRNYPQF